MILQCGERQLDLSQPRVMGVLNITPDSFSDGGTWLDSQGQPCLSAIRAQAEQMVSDGAVILDIGGESTRPGARAPSSAEELARVMPVVRALVDLPVVISVDTSTPSVMSACIEAGAQMINDVRAFTRQGALAVLQAHPHIAICLMHMQGDPQWMQQQPSYLDVVVEVQSFLVARARECEALGLKADQIVLDPGFGFGKRLEHNLQLLKALSSIVALGYPVLAGWSRKSSIGAITGQSDAKLRLPGSLAAAVLAAERGARLIRAHDVRETVEALAMVNALARVNVATSTNT